jgi:predicted GNAT family N-acyltransferase
MEIKPYDSSQEDQLYKMFEEEGPDWKIYYDEVNRPNYNLALKTSHTFLAYENASLCAFIRCREDNGFGVYIYDLLVKKASRGNKIGLQLMDHICNVFPDQTIYVMSDEDSYYEKMGCSKIGSIFEVKR